MMAEGMIDSATLRQLAADLEAGAEVLVVREKGTSGAHSAPKVVLLPDAVDRLLTGAIQAAQIHYRFAGQEWTDTIMAMKDGYRVVRCRHTG